MDDDIWLVSVPGWQGSSLRHWQTLWEKGYPFAQRVEQYDWLHPDREEWVRCLDDTLRELPGRAMLVAHSLGCLTVAHWAAQASMCEQAAIKGALLVAPPDLGNAYTQAVLPVVGFSPLPLHRLPFPSHVVSSDDDVYCSPEAAQALADAWGAAFTSIGAKGHINELSGLGDWEAGQRILQRMILG